MNANLSKVLFDATNAACLAFERACSATRRGLKASFIKHFRLLASLTCGVLTPGDGLSICFSTPRIGTGHRS